MIGGSPFPRATRLAAQQQRQRYRRHAFCALRRFFFFRLYFSHALPRHARRSPRPRRHAATFI